MDGKNETKNEIQKVEEGQKPKEEKTEVVVEKKIISDKFLKILGYVLLYGTLMLLLLHACHATLTDTHYSEFFGRRHFAIIDDGMGNTIKPGTLLACYAPKSEDDITEGTIVTFKTQVQSGNTIVVARNVVEVHKEDGKPTYYVTSGDGIGIDGNNPTYKDVIGIFKGTKINNLGFVFGYLHSTDGATALFFIIVFLLAFEIFSIYFLGDKKQRRIEEIEPNDNNAQRVPCAYLPEHSHSTNLNDRYGNYIGSGEHNVNHNYPNADNRYIAYGMPPTQGEYPHYTNPPTQGEYPHYANPQMHEEYQNYVGGYPYYNNNIPQGNYPPYGNKYPNYMNHQQPVNYPPYGNDHPEYVEHHNYGYGYPHYDANQYNQNFHPANMPEHNNNHAYNGVPANSDNSSPHTSNNQINDNQHNYGNNQSHDNNNPAQSTMHESTDIHGTSGDGGKTDNFDSNNSFYGELNEHYNGKK